VLDEDRSEAGAPMRLLDDGAEIGGSTNYGARMLILEINRQGGPISLPTLLDYDNRPWKPTCKNATAHVLDFNWVFESYTELWDL
jgi:hypothetical protein